MNFDDPVANVKREKTSENSCISHIPTVVDISANISNLPYIFLQPYQCSQSRNTESPRQGVRGSESFRVIHISGIL